MSVRRRLAFIDQDVTVNTKVYKPAGRMGSEVAITGDLAEFF
jgi:hypothetical protein